MLQKIISSGLNSAARAALDVALHLDIAHGGWISTGDVTARGRTASSYGLQELPSNLDCMEKCVTSADGTLLLTRGEIDGDLQAFRDFAQKNGRHFLHIDLERVPAFKASTVIADWLVHHKVDVLYAAGSGSDAPDTYEKIFHVITSAYWLTQAKIDEASAQHSGRTNPGLPRSISEAVSLLLTDMSLKDRTTLANMTEDELTNLNFTLGSYIRNAFGIWSGNEHLLEACRTASGDPTLPRKEAATVIIGELWKELRRTHKLRIVK
jgi:hypothetical protein